MSENYCEYKREHRKNSAPQKKTSTYLSRFVRQTAASLILFCIVFALRASSGTATKKSISCIKSALEYKVDTAKISSFIGTLAADVKSNIKLNDRENGTPNGDNKNAKESGTLESESDLGAGA